MDLDGNLTTDEELDSRLPGATALLQPETSLASPAFATVRQCASCPQHMAPWRVGATLVCVYRCTPCGAIWMPRGAFETLRQQLQREKIAAGYRTLSKEEQAELAADLTRDQQDSMPLSTLHAMLALIGIPVVTGIVRRRAPIVTWCLAGLLLAGFLDQLIDGGLRVSFQTLAYRSDDPELWSAFRAVFLHAGWLHLLGNVYFLLAFGDGVEQRLPRPAMIAAFVGLGALTLVCEGWTCSQPTLIAGASGGVAVLIGACIVLQPNAKVTTSLFAWVFRVGIVGYGAIEVGYQTFMLLMRAPGVAWVAHICGLILGIAMGLLVRRHQKSK